VNKLTGTYNSLLEKDPGLARECSDQFNRNMEERNVRFGDMIISNLLRPYFVSSDESNRFQEIIDALSSCTKKIIRLSHESKMLAEYLRLTKEEDDLISCKNGYSNKVVINRLDAFFNSDKKDIKFLEFNADSPGGIGYNDIMTRFYLDLPIFKILKKKYHYRFHPINTRKHLLKSLLDCYQNFGGKKKPTIGLIAWDHIKTYPEFAFIKECFEKEGYKTIIANPRALEYRKNSLCFKDTKIDLVLRKVLTSQILKYSDELKGLITAYKENRVCFANPLNSFLLSMKGVLAMLTDKKYSYLFTEKEKKIAKEVIPWTRKVEETKTDYKGKEIDLLDLIVKKRESFVLKPCDSFGAEGVFIGSETKQSDWEQTIKEGLKTRYIVQEKIRLPEETFPLSTSPLSFAKRNLNLGIYALGGRFCGGILRFSSSSIINTIGGGALPIIRVSKK
jgi:glutathionylspermidine synthase